MQKKVSVIIPIFNGEKYIKRCLNNINNQTLKDLEIIIINDASKDNTKNILLNLDKSLYKNDIKIIHLEKNKGLSNARNVGMEYSIGEYIQFIDVDDTVENNMLELTYNKSKKLDLDICIFNHKEIINNKSYSSKYKYKNNLINQEKLIKYFLIDKISPSACDKLFKKEFLVKNNIKFDANLKMCEDILFALNSFIKSKRVYTMNKYFYNYYQNELSLIHTISPKILQISTINKRLKKNELNILNKKYNKEFEFFKFYLVIRTIHSICLALNKFNKYQANKYLKHIFMNNKKLFFTQLFEKTPTIYLRLEILIFIIFGYKGYVFIFPLFKKLKNLRNSLL